MDHSLDVTEAVDSSTADLAVEANEHRASTRAGPAAVRTATIAICICTHDRLDGLANCLDTIARSDRSGLERDRLFVLVVDNNPQGHVRRLCEERTADVGLPIICVEEEVPGISYARNRAVREAIANGADFVAFIDDDDEPLLDWLSELMLTQRLTEAELVYGRWMNRPETVFPRYLSGVPYLHGPQGEGLCRYGLPKGIGTFNVLLARTLIERLAPDGVLFVTELARCGGSDRELFIRAHRLGVRHALAPRSYVMRGWGPERLSTGGIIKRSFRLGHTKAILDRRFRSGDSSFRKFRRNLLDLPFLALSLGHPKRWKSKRSRIARLYKVAKVAGEINGYLGRKLHYYGR